MNTFDDDDLERIFRVGLTHHAADAPAELSEPLLWSARTTANEPNEDDEPAGGTTDGGRPGSVVELPRARSRLSWPWALPAAAAAAVLAIPIIGQFRGPAGPSDPTAALGGSASRTTAMSSASGSTVADAAARPTGIPARWRPESYGGVQIWVPSDWGWGGTPMTPEWNGGARMDCSGMRAFTVPGSSADEFVPDNTPYVGRPVMMTDACGDGGPDSHPLIDAAWLGAPVEVGTQTYADGIVRETRAVGGVTVTVFGKDTDLRHRILDSARQVRIDANGCANVEPHGGSATSVTSAESLSVCVYDIANRARGASSLLFSTTLGADEATAYRKASAAAVAGKQPQAVVKAESFLSSVTIGLHGQDSAGAPVTRWDTLAGTELRVPVPGVEPGSFVATPLTKALAAPWAAGQGGVKAYVVGPGPEVPEVAPYFRGILG